VDFMFTLFYLKVNYKSILGYVMHA
jgi:hypothetical protein